MKFLILKTTDPYLNLAVEEYLFKKSTDDVFILWQNEPTVVIGKNQNIYAEIDFDYLKEKNIKVARRITGGGAVYHDLGNVNYTFISKSESGGIDFARFTSPIISALSSLGVQASLSGRNDIVIGERKISGNAQYSIGDRVLHHGTILFDSDLSVLSGVLRVDPEKIIPKALKSVRSRVANLKPLINRDFTVTEFINYLAEYVTERFSPEFTEAPVGEEVDALRERNASAEWLFPDKNFLRNYDLYRKKKFDFGIVSVDLKMSAEIISDVKIHGDFFGNGEISVLEKALKNTSVNDLEITLKNISIDSYIHKMTNAEFISLILNG